MAMNQGEISLKLTWTKTRYQNGLYATWSCSSKKKKTRQTNKKNNYKYFQRHQKKRLHHCIFFSLLSIAHSLRVSRLGIWRVSAGMWTTIKQVNSCCKKQEQLPHTLLHPLTLFLSNLFFSFLASLFFLPKKEAIPPESLTVPKWSKPITVRPQLHHLESESFSRASCFFYSNTKKDVTCEIYNTGALSAFLMIKTNERDNCAGLDTSFTCLCACVISVRLCLCRTRLRPQGFVVTCIPINMLLLWAFRQQRS